MSDTPRTDEAQFGERAGIDFARQLERELTEANQLLEEAEIARRNLGGLYQAAIQSHEATKERLIPQAKQMEFEIHSLRTINAELEATLEEAEMARKTLAGMYEAAIESQAATKNRLLPQLRRMQNAFDEAQKLLGQCLFELKGQGNWSASNDGLLQLIEEVESALENPSPDSGNAVVRRKLPA
jgi:DNA repair exonuclease SbcCD ATPase subunit